LRPPDIAFEWSSNAEFGSAGFTLFRVFTRRVISHSAWLERRKFTVGLLLVGVRAETVLYVVVDDEVEFFAGETVVAGQDGTMIGFAGNGRSS